MFRCWHVLANWNGGHVVAPCRLFIPLNRGLLGSHVSALTPSSSTPKTGRNLPTGMSKASFVFVNPGLDWHVQFTAITNVSVKLTFQLTPVIISLAMRLIAIPTVICGFVDALMTSLTSRSSSFHRRNRSGPGKHEACAEAAVLGRPDDITGQSIWAFCIMKPQQTV